jgi:hypothetical protein
LEIWPNPAREILNFKFSILNSGRDYELIIYDIFGREIYAEMISSIREGGGRGGGWQWQINVEGFPPGIYLAVVKEGSAMKAGTKFVVIR